MNRRRILTAAHYRNAIHRVPWRGPAALLTAVLLALACQPPTDDGGEASREAPPPTPAAQISSNDQNCEANPDWVSSPSEADAAAFRATSNCSFHQWAYQNFLWLTSPDPGIGGLVFERFANPNDLFVPGGPQEPYPGRAAGAPPKLLARLGKSRSSVDIEDIFQAGPGNKILVDQKGEVVYYSNHLNKDFWDFITEHQLYELASLQAASPALDFPVGALELKVSWRVAEKDGKVLIEDAEDRFFTLDARIPTVSVNDRGQIVEGEEVPAKMAMVGMHVTGVVQGHPEFIWATFEQLDNAPDCAADPNTAAADGPGPSGPWSFYAPGTATRLCNQFNTNDPLAVVNVCLVHPEGGGTDGSQNPNDNNRNAVRTLDSNVHDLVGGTLWASYELGGGVWTSGQVPLNNGAFSPTDQAAGATQLGSVDLANTTMETFTQDDNCFACHNGGAHEVVVGDTATEVNAKNINLSHFVVNYQAQQQVISGQSAGQ